MRACAAGDESGTWTGSAKSAQLEEEEENLEQKAAGAHRKGVERKNQRILTASKQDDRYCCRHCHARQSSSIKRVLILRKGGVTGGTEAPRQDK